jgi:NADH-quinone oxidoreductase subunit G
LGNLVDLDGFDYVDSSEVRDEVLAACGALKPDNGLGRGARSGGVQCASGDWERIGGVAIHAIDAITRRAPALQATPDAWRSGVRINPGAAQKLGVDERSSVRLSQGEADAVLPVQIDDAVPDGCIWLPTGVAGSERLGVGFGPIAVEKV